MTDKRDNPELLDQRKLDHIELTAEEDVEFRETPTLLEEVRFFHQSLPELAVDTIDTSTTFLGFELDYPIMISGMTGGTAKAREINRTLAAVAEEWGFGFGVGSQRAMMRDPSKNETYAVRDVAPSIPIFGNIGVVQAADANTAQLEELVEAIGASALCIHLNPAQEIIQDDGDRDFRGCVAALAEHADRLSVPIIAKETGCGMSPTTIQQIKDAGISAVDVSGAGGTTWVGVETLRGSDLRSKVGQALWEWGVPTAASVHYASKAGMEVIASGGLRTGVDIAKSIALGASIGSSALPWLRAAFHGGEKEAQKVAEAFVETLRAVMLLTGSRTVADLQKAEKRIGPKLREWIA
jgi:isopentenyl-diphosphate delta-isomerase